MIEKRTLTQIVNDGIANITGTQFFIRRGLSQKVIRDNSLGYLPEGLLPYRQYIEESPEVLLCYRYVIPDFDEHGGINYLLFRVDSETMSAVLPFEIDSSYGLGDCIRRVWNSKCLYKDGMNVVFITESWTDALSIIQCGGMAVALYRITNVLDLWKILSNRPLTSIRFVLACDGDYYGRKANKNLGDMLRSLGHYFDTLESFPPGIKDCNEWLTYDKEAFKKAVQSCMENKHETNW